MWPYKPKYLTPCAPNGLKTTYPKSFGHCITSIQNSYRHHKFGITICHASPSSDPDITLLEMRGPKIPHSPCWRRMDLKKQHHAPCFFTMGSFKWMHWSEVVSTYIVLGYGYAYRSSQHTCSQQPCRVPRPTNLENHFLDQALSTASPTNPPLCNKYRSRAYQDIPPFW